MAQIQETERGLHELIDAAPIGRTQIVVLLICFLLNIIDGYDVLAMAFAAPALAQDWSLPADQLGVVFSAGVLGMTLGAMFLAPQTDRIGRRPMVFGAVAIMGVSMLLTAWSQSLWQMVSLRVVTGLTIGTMLASLTSQVSEFFPDRLRNLAVGIMLSGYPLGATLGGFLAALLLPEYGWSGIFVAGGIMTLGMLPAIWLLLPESPQFLLHRGGASALGDINRVLVMLNINSLHTLPQGDGDDGEGRAGVAALLTRRHRRYTLQLWASFFFCFGTLYFLLSWIPKLLVDGGFPLEQAIYAGIAFNIGGAVGNLVIGWTSMHFGLQRTILMFHVFAATGMLVFALSPMDIAALLLLTGLIGLFQQGGFVGFYMVAARLYPAGIRTTGIGWGIGLGRFGAVLAPYIAGLLIAAGWSLSMLFIIFALPLLLGGAMIYFIRAKTLPR